MHHRAWRVHLSQGKRSSLQASKHGVEGASQTQQCQEGEGECQQEQVADIVVEGLVAHLHDAVGARARALCGRILQHALEPLCQLQPADMLLY